MEEPGTVEPGTDDSLISYEQAPSPQQGQRQNQRQQGEQPVPLEEQGQERIQPEQQQQQAQQQPQQQQQQPQQQQAQQQPQQQQPQQQQPQQQPQQQQAQQQPQRQQAQQQPRQQPQQPQEQQQTGRQVPLIEGLVQGTVREIDLAGGSVTIESAGQQADLQAHPSDLAELQEGENVELAFTAYPDGSRWLEQEVDANQVLRSSESVGQISGQIDAVDEDAGIVAVGGETFRAHPDQLERMSRGESVSLSYAEIDGTPWVAEIEPGSAQQQQQQASAEPAPRPLDEQHTESDIDWYFENAG